MPQQHGAKQAPGGQRSQGEGKRKEGSLTNHLALGRGLPVAPAHFSDLRRTFVPNFMSYQRTDGRIIREEGRRTKSVERGGPSDKVAD